MGVLTTIRDFARDALSAADEFDGLDVLSEDKGVIANEVARALKAVGLMVVVQTPGAARSATDARSTRLEGIALTIQVGENAVTNRTGKRASDVAEAVLAVLTHQQLEGTFEPLVPRNPPLQFVPVPGNLAGLTCLYHVNFETSAGLAMSTPTPTVAAPTGNTSNLAAITLACATAGATIHYTLDGTAPSPNNGTLYTAAFVGTAGQILRARAGRWGYKASSFLKVTLA